MSAVNGPAPDLQVQEWVQGGAASIAGQKGQVILIEVFQVNCPGCFVGGLPEAVELFGKFKDRGLVVWGLATAFEDFTVNTLANLKKLLHHGEVVGETQAHLAAQNALADGRCPFKIPFPVAWDVIDATRGAVQEEDIMKLARRDFPNFADLPDDVRQLILRQARAFLQNKTFTPKTFDAYGLRGTPSAVLIDKKGILRHKFFGSGHDLESHIKTLLEE